MPQAYSLTEASTALPTIVDAAMQGDVSILTDQNQPVAVILSYATYQRLTARLALFMQLSPLVATQLAYTRDRSPLRPDAVFD